MTIKPAVYDKEVLYAWRAMFEGKANEGQQKRAVEWLLFNACHIGALSFNGDDAETKVREGERHIGLQIARMREPEALKLIEGRSRADRLKAATTKTEATERGKE